MKATLRLIQNQIIQPENKDLPQDDPKVDHLSPLQRNLEELKRLHGELRGILDELEEAVR